MLQHRLFLLTYNISLEFWYTYWIASCANYMESWIWCILTPWVSVNLLRLILPDGTFHQLVRYQSSVQLSFYPFYSIFLMAKPLLRVSAGLPCRSSTRHARCRAGTTTSQGASLSRGWPSTRAASPRSRAASTSGTLWPTWRRPGPTRPPCSSTGETRHTLTGCSAFVTSLVFSPLTYWSVMCRPTERERTECLIKAKLRNIMTFQDLENITSKEVCANRPPKQNNTSDFQFFFETAWQSFFVNSERHYLPYRFFTWLYDLNLCVNDSFLPRVLKLVH